MTFPLAPLQRRLRIAPGTTDFGADPSTYPWIDISTYVDDTFEISDTIGTTDDATETNTEFSCTLRNNDSRFTSDNPESPYWPFFVVGCPIEYALDNGDGGGWRIQCITYLGASVVSWTAGTQYRCIATITAGGQFRRLGLDPPIASALRRTIPTSAKRKAYYPMEDAAGSTQAASAIPTAPPLISAPGQAPVFGSTAGVPGAASCATFELGDRLSASLTSPTTANALRVSFTLYVPTAPGGTPSLFELTATGGTVARYGLELGAASLRFRAFGAGGAELSGASAIGFTDQYTQTVYVDVDIAQSGANITWAIKTTRWAIDATGQPVGTSGTASGSWAGTLGQVTGYAIAPYLDLPGVEIGHWSLTEPPLPGTGGFAAVVGWAGNTAAGRVAGMAIEFGLPYSVTSTTLGAVMGPQLVGSLLTNLRDCQNTDHGVLTDHLGVIGYRALSELYNLGPTMSLNRSVRGQIGRIPLTFDDQVKANVASASRPGGSTYTVTDDADILRAGRYERSPITVNVGLDSALPGHAGWSLARGRGSERGPRLPELTFNMRVACEATPALGTQALGMQLGNRIAISAGPHQMTKGEIDRQVRGRKQTVNGRYDWKITYFLVPTEPYNAFILDTDRLDTAGTETVLAANTTDTVLMAATAGPLITTGAGLSIPLNAAGEQVTLTAVASEPMADPFTRTVANGWGSTPATAHLPAYAYTHSGSSGAVAGDWAATGTAATMSIALAGGSRSSRLDGIVLLNPDLSASCTYPGSPTGNSLEMQLNYRRDAAGTSSYTFRVNIETTGRVLIQFYAYGGALLAELPAPFVHSSGQTYNLRIAPIGSRHLCKVWIGSVEPVAWNVDLIDTSRVVPGSIFVRGGRSVGNTNTPAVATWDNLTLRNTQALTVTRSVNGIVKSLPLNSAVKLWKGRGLGI